MHRSKCPVCGSTNSVKNGRRKGIQLYKCKDCGYQFRNDRIPDGATLWRLYLMNKQTVAELAESFHCSESTVKRRLRDVDLEWEQPRLEGGGFVHLDVTYWGRNWGVLLAIDAGRGGVLYMAFVRSETRADYEAAVASIKARGYKIRGIVIDGKKCLFDAFAGHKIQMRQFHMRQIVRRYLTKNPRLKAARALSGIMDRLTTAGREEFDDDYARWKAEWRDTLCRRTVLKSGRKTFTHSRLRAAVHSIDFYLPYLFTFQDAGCDGMPNTNNRIEGVFTDLKKNLNNHSGMTEMNRKRFICGFFLAWAGPLA